MPNLWFICCCAERGRRQVCLNYRKIVVSVIAEDLAGAVTATNTEINNLMRASAIFNDMVVRHEESAVLGPKVDWPP